MLDAGLSIYSSDLTNEDIVVTYVPASNVVSYSYKILKNDEEIESYDVLNNSSSDIKLNQTGDYHIEITTFDGNTYNTITSGVYKIDKELPVIKLDKSIINIKKDQNIDVLDGVVATDNIDGDITSKVITNIKDLNLSKKGHQTLIYQVSDEAGNQTTKNIDIYISRNTTPLLFSQIILIVALLFFLIYTFIYNKSVKKEKRLSKYTLKSLKDNNKSLFETFNQMGNSIIDRIANIIRNSELANKQSLKYEKYVKAFKLKSSIRFVAQKVFVSFIFLIIGFIIATLRFEILNIYEIVVLLIVGYYLLDLIFKYKYYIYCKEVENDLLQAIVIMKSAFNSGRSITQAIDLVGSELEGPISDEFKKISEELKLGLDVNVAFKRFAERINIEEAAYLTSSLSILNKTGGNIVKVFSSIEQTLMNRKKMRIELKELTGSSRLIMWVLTVVPIVFILLISFVNPEYFNPLFTNVLGFVIIGAIILLYVIYIIVVRKIMKIRM